MDGFLRIPGIDLIVKKEEKKGNVHVDVTLEYHTTTEKKKITTNQRSIIGIVTYYLYLTIVGIAKFTNNPPTDVFP